MRVKGNVSPDVLDIEPYAPTLEYAEVRLRENINEISVFDKMTETPITMYEYDEYTFVLREKEGLQADIEANMDDWLTTGRTLEVDPMATLYVTARVSAIDEYTEELIKEGLL